ncbi:MAG: putative transposase [Planctomycetota bacterium]|jgi:transposase
MNSSAPPGELFPASAVPEGVEIINERCLVRTKDHHRAVIVAGIPLAHYSVGDRMAEAHAMILLVSQGWADQNDVARAFGCASRTLRRLERRFDEGGLSALGRPQGYPKGRPRLPRSRLRTLQRLKSQGWSNREAAQHLGVTEKAVRKLLRRLGWNEPRVPQLELAMPSPGADPNVSASSILSAAALPERPSAPADPNQSAFSIPAEPLPVSLDADPMDRRLDRFFACVGLLDDAAPLFQSATRVPQAGLLLAVPAILGSGVLDAARAIYGSIGPAFYGLRTTLVTLLLMALSRIRRPEGLKERVPQDLGRVLGLDRAPEVKTIRRKLARLAAFGRATAFGRALAEHRVAQRGAALGFLYVDGHVRVYHGERALPKAHVARMRLAMPATTDYWVNDGEGEPLFVVTAEANAGLWRMLPEILAELRPLVGERRLTVVFDRGGWSPKLFQRLLADGFDLLTYRKGRFRKVPRSCFEDQTMTVDGRAVRYRLADQGVHLLSGALRLRQVTRLSEDGHQTPIVTSRRDLPAAMVAYRMFERWRQENFFKYMREEYALDALVDYGVEPADAEREVPNPARTELDERIRAARAEIHRLTADFGTKALLNEESGRPTMRGFKIAHAGLRKRIRDALRQLLRLRTRRRKTPARVPVKSVTDGLVVKLAPERKHLTNLLKMVAYQVESELAGRVQPHYRRAEDEGRTLVQSMLASVADLHVTDTELRVTIAPLSSAHKTRVLVTLCEELNRMNAVFPGSRLRLRYAVGRAL